MSEMKPGLRLLLGYAVLGCGLVWGQGLWSSSALVREHAGPTHQIRGRQAGLSIPRNQIWRTISNALRLRGFEEGSYLQPKIWTTPAQCQPHKKNCSK